MDIILCLIIVCLLGIEKRLKEIENINFNIRVENDRQEIESAVNRIVRNSNMLGR